MAQPKFLSLLGSLDKKELSEFAKYLRTAHAREKITLRVFQHFKNSCQESSGGKGLDLEKVALKVFSTGPVSQGDRKSLLNSLHDLYVILKKYLLAKKLDDKSMEREALWLSVLRDRGMAADYGKAANSLFGRVRELPKLDTLDYLKNMLVSYLSSHGYVENKMASDAELEEYCRTLEAFHAISLLKVQCEFINRQNQQGSGAELFEMGASRDIKEVAELPLWSLYKKVQELLLEGTNEKYLSLEKAMSESVGRISRDELRTVLGYLKNHCIKKIREGDISYCRKVHLLDKFDLEHSLHIEENGSMSVVRFFNVISAAVAVEEFQWAAQFVKQHVGSIEEPVRYEVSVLAEAMLLFAKKDYARVLKKLKSFEGHRSKAEHAVVRIRLLKLVSMAELKLDIEQQLNEAMGFQHYLKRVASPRQDMIRASLNFLRIFQMLAAGKKDRGRIAKEIAAAKNLLHYRPWLLQKLGDYRPL